MMERRTVDFGIDLGTTNSVIARSMRGKLQVIKNSLQSEITPSAVVRTHEGQIRIGQDALNNPDLEPAVQFKRLMGTSHQTQMRDGSMMLPEELSAEILKELRAIAGRRYDESPEYVVITVPAMFQQPQCQATHRAAELAGMTAVALIQEPIAAATAYINDCPDEGYYLVYDLGGGTFDVSVIRLRDGEMNVITHGGDNHLGGSDFDREIVEWAVHQIGRETGKGFCPKTKREKHYLRDICEDCKKRLSDQESVAMDLSDLNLPIAQLQLDRAILEDLIEPQVSRTISLARERLDAAGLRAGDVRRVLLVGGPTMTPYIRRRIKQDLGIPISLDQDPMTVVAAGAAIHAGSILQPTSGKPHSINANTNSACIELYYEPVSPDVHASVSGKVIEPKEFVGEVRITKSSSDWDSGWMPLRSAAFVCDVLLSSNTLNSFQVYLRDIKGTVIPADPDTITITHGIAAARPVTPYDYGIAVDGGAFSVILPRELALPSYAPARFEATKTIAAGSPDEIVVHFLEGNSPVACDNVKVGEVKIRGLQLKRTLREGENVEVWMRMDESRLLKARVSIPLHDLDYEVELQSMIECPPTVDLVHSVGELNEIITSLADVTEESDEMDLRQSQREAEQIEADLDHLESGEVGVAERVAAKLAETKARVRKLHSMHLPAIRHQEATQSIAKAERMASQFNDSLGLATLADLRDQADRCLRLDDDKGLLAIEEKANGIFWQHYVCTEECWIGLVDYLRGQRTFAADNIAYDEYLGRADECLRRRDFEGVRLNGIQALNMLPNSRGTAHRFYGAHLRAIG